MDPMPKQGKFPGDAMTDKPKKGPAPADFVFSLGVPANIKADDTGVRRFSGVGYTGDPILHHPWWGTVIFDLSLMSVPSRMAILLNHEADDIVGYSDEFAITDDGLVLGGILSKVTEAGKEVTALSDEGFPWQMSVRIQPSRIEEVTAGTVVVVNNRSVTGPASIFRESTIVETSFTPTGWDSGSSATALSRTTNPTSQEDLVSKELEDKVAQLEGELRTSNDRANALQAELNTLKEADAAKAADARMSRIKEAYSKAGKDLSDDDAKKFSAMPDDAIAAIVDALSVSTLPPILFSHQATGQTPAPSAPGSALLAFCTQVADAHTATKK